MDSEDYKELKQYGKNQKQNTREQATAEINALRLYPEFKVEQITEYHFRINDLWDLYPTSKKIFKVGVTTNFAGWKHGELLDKLRLIIARGSVTSKKFDLKYFSRSGTLIETVVNGEDWNTCNRRQKQIFRSGTHKVGVLKIVPHLMNQPKK